MSNHKQAFVRFLIKQMRNASESSLLFPNEELNNDGFECVITGVFFPTDFAETELINTKYGYMWIGIWANDSSPDFNGNVYFPEWLADIILEESGISIASEDILYKDVIRPTEMVIIK